MPAIVDLTCLVFAGTWTDLVYCHYPHYYQLNLHRWFCYSVVPLVLVLLSYDYLPGALPCNTPLQPLTRPRTHL